MAAGGATGRPGTGPRGPAVPLPAGVHLVPDRDLAVLGDGRALLGGSPTRLLRLRPRAAQMLRRWLDGEAVGDHRAERAVARRLVTAGMLHPRPQPVEPGALVTVVVPVRDRPELLERLLGSLGPVRCVVVDDASIGRAQVEKVTREAGAEYLRLDTRTGPAAARNAGLATVTSPLVAFVDSDCTVPPGWLGPLVAHFADPAVALVAPRVVTPGGRSSLARYEAGRSPLDLGTREGPIGPGRPPRCPVSTPTCAWARTWTWSGAWSRPAGKPATSQRSKSPTIAR